MLKTKYEADVEDDERGDGPKVATPTRKSAGSETPGAAALRASRMSETLGDAAETGDAASTNAKKKGPHAPASNIVKKGAVTVSNDQIIAKKKKRRGACACGRPGADSDDEDDALSPLDEQGNYVYGKDIGYSFDTFFESYIFSMLRWSHVVGEIAFAAEAALLAASEKNKGVTGAATDELCRNLLSVWEDQAQAATRLFEVMLKDGWLTSPTRDMRMGLIRRAIKKKDKHAEEQLNNTSR